MCECAIISSKNHKPIEVPVLKEKFKFFIEFQGKKHELLSDIPIAGTIDYCAAFSIKQQYDCKSGWIIVVGEKMDLNKHV
jgi:hypothetical protein